MLEPIVIALIKILGIVFGLLQLVIIVSVLISLLGADPYNQIVRLITDLTEPIYRPIRKLTSKIAGPFDLAPLVAIFGLILIQEIIMYALHKLIQ